MKKLIGRTLFWFKKEDEPLVFLHNSLNPLARLLNRLMNEVYSGKKIKFINIDFASAEKYQLHPLPPVYNIYYHGGHLNYSDILDFNAFEKMSDKERSRYLWKRSNEILLESSIFMKTPALLEAANYAYNKGLKLDLNPNYNVLEKEAEIYGHHVKLAIEYSYKKDVVYSIFIIEKNGIIIFEKQLDMGAAGSEFFLEIYKKIEVQNNCIILKGHYEIDYLPMKIVINENIFHNPLAHLL